MKAKLISAIIVLLMIVGSFGAVVTIVDRAESREDFDYVSGEVIVGFKELGDLEKGDKDPILGNKILKTNPSIQTALIKVPEGREDIFINLYVEDNRVRYAHKNGILQKVGGAPNDPGWGKQWGPENIGCLDAWDQGINNKVTIAIVDTGIDHQSGDIHEDLRPRYSTGRNIVANPDNDNPWDTDSHTHGTHCCGIAAAAANNNIGIAGVTGSTSRFPNIELMAVKVLGPDGGSASDVADGITWAANNDADVISMSLGCYSHFAVIENACNYAFNQEDCVLVAASGNDHYDLDSHSPHYPSGYDSVISVAATNSQNKLASFSNYGGTTVDIAAPGVRIWSCAGNNGYRYLSGTSMACPHVAGVAAIARARYPGWSAEDIREELFETADKLGAEGVHWIHGRVDATLDGEWEEPEEMPTVTVHLDKLTNDWTDDSLPEGGSGLDALDAFNPLFPPDNPEWLYKIEVITDDETQSVKNYALKKVNYNDNTAEKLDGELDIKFWTEEWTDDDASSNLWDIDTHNIFSVNQKEVTVKIKLMEEDEFYGLDLGQDTADISDKPESVGEPDHRYFTAKYNFVDHEIIESESDKYKKDGSYYYTRGDWDGSTGGPEYKQDDAMVWFKITDDYVPPTDPTIELLDDSKLIEKHTVFFEGNATGFRPFTYNWDFGDDNTATGKSPSHEYEEPGDYQVTLTIEDRFGGESDEVKQTISVGENSAPGKPHDLRGTEKGKAGSSYTYTCDPVTDPDDDDVTYQWKFGDGTGIKESTSPEKSHTWSERGSYTVEVRAIDDYGGESDWATLSVRMPKTKSVTNPLIFDFISHFQFLKLFFPFLEPLLLK